MNEDIKKLKRLLDYSLRKYIEDENEDNLNCLISALETFDDLDCNSIELELVYLLLYIYCTNKNIFPIKIQSYLQNLFHRCFKKCQNLRLNIMQKELLEIERKINSTNNMYNDI